MYKHIFCVGLTGGIASGKSTVINYFNELNIHTICADFIAKSIVKPDSKILSEIASHFGQQILHKDGSLDRKQLRNIIFDKKQEKKWLEELLHPEIRTQIKNDIIKAKSSYCVIDIPLLTDSYSYDYLDMIVTIDISTKAQIVRLTERDNISRKDAEKIINSQLPRAQRFFISDYILQNKQDVKSLESQVKSLHQHILGLIDKN